MRSHPNRCRAGRSGSLASFSAYDAPSSVPPREQLQAEKHVIPEAQRLGSLLKLGWGRGPDEPPDFLTWAGGRVRSQPKGEGARPLTSRMPSQSSTEIASQASAEPLGARCLLTLPQPRGHGSQNRVSPPGASPAVWCRQGAGDRQRGRLQGCSHQPGAPQTSQDQAAAGNQGRRGPGTQDQTGLKREHTLLHSGCQLGNRRVNRVEFFLRL